MNQTFQQQHTKSTNLETVKACPLCDGGALTVRFGVKHITDDPVHSLGLELGLSTATIYECGDCGFLFKCKQPAATYIRQHYFRSGERYLESLADDQYTIREDLRVAHRLLLENFPHGGSILDVGCASGFFLESLGKSWDRHGLELSQLAAERARMRPGIIVHECDIASAEFDEESFDVVCCLDVIEHLAKPMTMFHKARRILKPGGWLLMGTGDIGSLAARASGKHWTYICIPEHLSFFSRRSLCKALSKAGFSHIDFTRVHHGERNRSAAIGWLRAVGKHWAITLFGKDIVRLRIFRQKTAQFLVPYFFDHMICIAQ